MREIPGPRIVNAVPMPNGNSRDWIVHPGPDLQPRFLYFPCSVRNTKLALKAGQNLNEAVGSAVGAEGADGACVYLDGVRISEMHYVMPDGPLDEKHAAWYSETCILNDIQLEHATASVGHRDGAWFLHTHAKWNSGQRSMGHLLNDRCIVAEDCTINAWLLDGAWLEVAHDPETDFPLFAPVGHNFKGTPKGCLLTIRPHEDVRKTIERVCEELGFVNASIHGIGSLIGAAFSDSASMSAQMSEVLLLEGCRVFSGSCKSLPIACVDPWGNIFIGDLLSGQGPVCVTFELLVVGEEG